MMKIAIVSLRFAPGHIAHLKAYRELFKTLGVEVKLFLDTEYKEFVKEDSSVEFIDCLEKIFAWNPDIVISYNIAIKNIKLAQRCKSKMILFYYVLHEPWDSIKNLIGQKERLFRRIAANLVNLLTCYLSAKILLASENGKEKYEKYMGFCNKDYIVFPLVFCDEFINDHNIKRKYFSFIGGFTNTRGSEAFLNFVEFALEIDLNIIFLIATRSSINVNNFSNKLKRALSEKRLIIHSGSPMSTNEINRYYRESICVWNAYTNTTQSGVLPNSLMQGTPVIVTNRGSAPCIVRDGKEGRFIELPHRNKEILNAFYDIKDNISNYSKNARRRFLDKYYCKNNTILELAKQIFSL